MLLCLGAAVFFGVAFALSGPFATAERHDKKTAAEG
jgi:hypothetical protein